MLRIATLLICIFSLSVISRADIPPPYDLYGIGASIAEAEPFPTLTVVPGSPAAKAGLQSGDAVIGIDTSYAKGGAPFYFFARGLQGRQDSNAQLVILRGGNQVLVFNVRRTVRLR